MDSVDAKPDTGLPSQVSGGGDDNVDARISGLTIRGGSGSREFETDECYRMDYPRRGEFIIINNMKFQPQTQMGERAGTNEDAKNLMVDFKRLGFEVSTYQNQTATEMLKLMIEASDRDHSTAACFGVAVLTHGDNSVLYGVDRILEVDKFVSPIKSCRSLAGKPKIFIFQACRGTVLDSGVELNDAEVDKPDVVQKIPLEADFLYAYSTVPGYFAWRNSRNGSWFIQGLHRTLEKYGTSKLDFVKLLTRVNRMVAYEFESNASQPHMNKKKQVPSIVSMLTKDLYFSTN
jgi:hypothetical protein